MNNFIIFWLGFVEKIFFKVGGIRLYLVEWFGDIFGLNVCLYFFSRVSLGSLVILEKFYI